MYALNIAEDGRLLSATYPQYAPVDAVIVDTLPEGNLPDYLYVDGEYIYDPLPRSEPEEPPVETSVWDELDAAYQSGINSI
jgi:hypothetical protein